MTMEPSEYSRAMEKFSQLPLEAPLIEAKSSLSLVYFEKRIDGIRTFILNSDSIRIHGKNYFSLPFDVTFTLNHIDPHMKRLWVRSKFFIAGLCVLTLGLCTTFWLWQLAPETTTHWNHFIFLLIGIIPGLTVTLACIKRIEFASFKNLQGITVFDIARSGPMKDRFDDVVLAIILAITTSTERSKNSHRLQLTEEHSDSTSLEQHRSRPESLLFKGSLSDEDCVQLSRNIFIHFHPRSLIKITSFSLLVIAFGTISLLMLCETIWPAIAFSTIALITFGACLHSWNDRFARKYRRHVHQHLETTAIVNDQGISYENINCSSVVSWSSIGFAIFFPCGLVYLSKNGSGIISLPRRFLDTETLLKLDKIHSTSGVNVIRKDKMMR